MWNRLSRLLGVPGHPPSPEDETAVMRSLFGLCPVCKEEMTGHSYFQLASVFLDDVGKNDELAGLIQIGQWQKVLEFQDWQTGRDERVYYAVRCPNQTELLIFTVIGTWEMLVDDITASRESLSPPSSLALAQLIGNRWQKI